MAVVMLDLSRFKAINDEDAFVSQDLGEVRQLGPLRLNFWAKAS